MPDKTRQAGAWRRRRLEGCKSPSARNERATTTSGCRSSCPLFLGSPQCLFQRFRRHLADCPHVEMERYGDTFPVDRSAQFYRHNTTTAAAPGAEHVIPSTRLTLTSDGVPINLFKFVLNWLFTSDGWRLHWTNHNTASTRWTKAPSICCWRDGLDTPKVD